jgi:hypothetical protein
VVPTVYGYDPDTFYLHGSVASQSLNPAGTPVCVTITLTDALVRIRRARPRAHPVHRRPRPHPVPRRRGHLLPALRAPARQRRWHPGQPERRHPRHPRHRTGRQRTSGRTAAERRTRHTEEVTCTIDITKSNLPQWDIAPET